MSVGGAFRLVRCPPYLRVVFNKIIRLLAWHSKCAVDSNILYMATDLSPVRATCRKKIIIR